MLCIYYSYYTPVSDSIPAVAAQEHHLGRQLLINGLERFYGLCYSPEELEIVLNKDANGKPFLSAHPEIHFNITHCDGLAACAFHNQPIGIDAELPGYFAPVLIKKALSQEEIDFLQRVSSNREKEQEWFFRFWTLKEAFVKQSGIGVDTDLTAFSFSFYQRTDSFRVTCSVPEIACWQTQLENNQIISVCYPNTKEPVQLLTM